MPLSLKHIGDSAFELTHFNNPSLPDGLEYIGDYAFGGSSVYELNLPDSVRRIGLGAFSGSGIERLALEYNQARQTAITQEVNEITAGADAL